MGQGGGREEDLFASPVQRPKLPADTFVQDTLLCGRDERTRPVYRKETAHNHIRRSPPLLGVPP